MRRLFFAAIMSACAPGTAATLDVASESAALVDVTKTADGLRARLAMADFRGLATVEVAHLVGTGALPELGCTAEPTVVEAPAEDEYFVDLVNVQRAALRSDSRDTELAARIFPSLGSIGGVVYQAEDVNAPDAHTLIVDGVAIPLSVPQQVEAIRVDGSIWLDSARPSALPTHTLEWQPGTMAGNAWVSFRFANAERVWTCTSRDHGLLNLDGDAAHAFERADWVEAERVVYTRNNDMQRELHVVTRATRYIVRPAA